MASEESIDFPVDLCTAAENLAAVVPPSPIELLRLAEIFVHFGAPRTAAYLRRCADVMAISMAKPVGMVTYPGFAWDKIPHGEEIRFNWYSDSALGFLRGGVRYALVPLDGDPQQDLQAEAAQASDRG